MLAEDAEAKYGDNRKWSAVLVPLTTLVFPITAFGVFATGTADGDGRRVQPRMGDVRVGEGPRSPWWSEVLYSFTEDAFWRSPANPGTPKAKAAEKAWREHPLFADIKDPMFGLLNPDDYEKGLEEAWERAKPAGSTVTVKEKLAKLSKQNAPHWASRSQKPRWSVFRFFSGRWEKAKIELRAADRKRTGAARSVQVRRPMVNLSLARCFASHAEHGALPSAFQYDGPAPSFPPPPRRGRGRWEPSTAAMPIGAFEIPCPRKPEALNCGASALLPDDSEDLPDDYHAESCSPVGSAVPQSPFITMGRTRHLRRTCNVVFEEMRICGALQQHLEDLNSNVPFEELWQPIHVAAHLGASASDLGGNDQSGSPNHTYWVCCNLRDLMRKSLLCSLHHTQRINSCSYGQKKIDAGQFNQAPSEEQLTNEQAALQAEVNREKQLAAMEESADELAEGKLTAAVDHAYALAESARVWAERASALVDATRAEQADQEAVDIATDLAKVARRAGTALMGANASLQALDTARFNLEVQEKLEDVDPQMEVYVLAKTAQAATKASDAMHMALQVATRAQNLADEAISHGVTSMPKLRVTDVQLAPLNEAEGADFDDNQDI
eukprot:g23065.t1